MNTESSLFREISLEDIKNITYRHLGTREISQARLMEGGLFNTTYHLICGSDNRQVILRLGPVNRHLLLGFEEHLMEAETYVYELFQATRSPVPVSWHPTPHGAFWTGISCLPNTWTAQLC